MSELSPATSATNPGLADEQTLRQLLAAAVVGVDGVNRLEPTLMNLLANIAAARPRVLPNAGPKPESADGIVITTRAAVTDVTIDIATDRQALETAAIVRERVCGLLIASGREPGHVTVNVLNTEPPPA